MVSGWASAKCNDELGVSRRQRERTKEIEQREISKAAEEKARKNPKNKHTKNRNYLNKPFLNEHQLCKLTRFLSYTCISNQIGQIIRNANVANVHGAT